jgi:hypothetical protein
MAGSVIADVATRAKRIDCFITPASRVGQMKMSQRNFLLLVIECMKLFALPVFVAANKCYWKETIYALN